MKEQYSRQQIRWLTVILAILALIVLALLHMYWQPAGALGTLVRESIPSAVVVLVAIPVVYFLFDTHGIPVTGATSTDDTEDKGTGGGADTVTPHGVRFFLTTPLSGVGTQQEYEAFTARMRPILASIRGMKGVDHVYYFNELVATIDEFHKDKWSVPEYFNEIDQADYVVVIVNTSSVSAVYYEAGFALARHIKAIYFVGPNGKIPHLMAQCAFTYPKLVRHQEFTSLDEIPELLRRIMPVLQIEEPSHRPHLTGDRRRVAGR